MKPTTNGSLDSRRWQALRAERDDLPLFRDELTQVHQVLNSGSTTVQPRVDDAVRANGQQEQQGPAVKRHGTV